MLVTSIFSFSPSGFHPSLTLSQTSPGFYVSAVQALSPFPTVFSTLSENFSLFSSNLKLSSANSFSLEESKIVIWERVKQSSVLSHIYFVFFLSYFQFWPVQNICHLVKSWKPSLGLWKAFSRIMKCKQCVIVIPFISPYRSIQDYRIMEGVRCRKMMSGSTGPTEEGQ